MATKNITNEQVLLAYEEAIRQRAQQKKLGTTNYKWPEDILHETTKEPIKVCFRAMERAERKGLIEYGTSLRSGWLTEAGKTLLKG